MNSLRHGTAPGGALPVLLGLALALACLPCDAALGSAPTAFGNTSVRHARALAASAGASATSGTNAAGTGAAYDVDVSTLSNGTTVREYVAGGVVFAVSWSGPFLPDLRALLGRHFATLTDPAVRGPRAGRGPVRIAARDVIIESTGHMRAYTGRAWVASLLPAGFDTGDIE